MSADSTLAFFGVRWTLREEEIEPLEARGDARIQLARQFKLDHWWGRLVNAEAAECYYLFIGKKIGCIGYECSYEKRYSWQDMIGFMQETANRLKEAGLQEEPTFYIQLEPDY